MGILVFLKTILDIRNIGKLFLEFFAFLKKNKLLPIVYVVPIVIFILYYLSGYLFIKDNEIDVERKRASMDSFIDKNLHQCGDKTAISVSIVHSNQRVGRFFSARACDFRLGSDCILNLMSNKPLIYGVNYKLNANTRDFLTRLITEGYPRKIPLSKDGEQYIDDQIDGCTPIIDLIQATDWWQEGIAKNLWITASKSKDGILYVFTFKTAVDKTECDTEINSILLELKQKMEERKWWFLQY